MCDSKKTKKTPFEELRTPRSRAAKLKMNPSEAQAARGGNMMWGKFERRGGKYKVAVIAVLLAIGCSLVYFFHGVLGSEAIFSHFFYIPVVLACVWWKRKGLTVAVFLSACLILSHIFLKLNVATSDDYFRAGMFMAVALIVTVLSEYAAKVEEKLERYRFMVESAQDAIFFKDLKSRYIIANDKALEAFGLSREQVIGKNDNEIMSNKDEAGKNIEDDQLVFKTGRLTEITKQMTDVNGKERWFQAVKAPQFDDKGNTVGLVGIARDVTGHKKTEELLGAERQRLYSLLDKLPAFVYLQAPDHSVRFANRYFREHFGDPEGKSCYEVLWGAKEPCKPCPTFRVFDTKKPQIWEWSQSPDGRIYEINDYPFSDVDGSPVVLELGIDITEHKKAEEALRDKTRALDAILTNLKQGIAYLDENDTIIYLNQQCADSFGLKYEDVFQKNIYKFHSSKKRGAVRALVKEFKQGKQYLNVIETVGNKVVDKSFHRIEDDDGNYQGILMTAADITERKQTENILAQERNLLRVLVDTLPDVIFVKDTNSAFVFSNIGCARQLKAESAEAVIGKTDFDFLPQELAERFYAEEQEIIRTGQPVLNDEIGIEDESGKIGKWLSRTKIPWRDDNGNIIGIVGLIHDITESKRAEARLAKVNECFLSFGTDPVENIQLLTAMCGEQLEACCALYNRLESDMLCSTGHWNVPSDYKQVDKAEGHICFDVIRKSRDDIFIVRNLPETTYFHTDPNVAAYGLKTYIGKAVKCHGKYIGSACVVYKGDIELSRDDKRILEIVASAIGVEEERKQAEEALEGIRNELEIRVEQRTAELARTNEELRNEISEREKAEQRLLGYQNRLRSLASELSLAEERLRRRMATDVHDHIGQNLAISKIKLESLAKSISSPEHSGVLEEICDLVAQTIESARSLTFELSPPVLYDLGFEPAMEWLVRETRRRHGLSAEFADDGQKKPLDNNIRVLLFQAVRELLLNIVKHAQARNVTVSTRRLGDEICVSVEDDGVGFNMSEAGSYEYRTGGFGLFSIRERLGHVGGHLDVESGPGHGTRISLVAPMGRGDQSSREQIR